MIDEYEFYHGAVLRDLIVNCGRAVQIKVDDTDGRVDSFVVDDKVAIHVKHSAKRMTPWQFTFSRQNIEELIKLDSRYHAVFICLVCSDDGVVTITPEEFLQISGPAKSETYWIRLHRSKNKMYSVSGNGGELSNKKARGMGSVVEAIVT